MQDDLLKRAKELFTPALVFHTGIVAARASGARVTSFDAKRYLDFSSGLAVLNVGHSHERVVSAVKEQIESGLIHVGCMYYAEAQVRLAEKLKEITPDGIEKFFFSNSGAEAIEGAIKLARRFTGRQGIVAFTNSFHGRTLGALSLTASSARYRQGYEPLLPSVHHAPYPYCFRCPMGQRRDSCSIECLDYLKRVILRHITTPREVACVVIEPVLGEGGYVVPPAAFMQGLKRLCEGEGILLVADEVQTGFGRTGRWFASEHYGVRPDIMTMAKGIASGFPLSAIGASANIMDAWPPGAHGTTFGGNPVSCASAIATIDVIRDEGLLENAESLGNVALNRLNALKEKDSRIGDVRGVGLMIGVEFVKADNSPDTELVKKVIGACLEQGLIIVECGVDKNILRIMPPLNTTKDELKEALDIFERALKQA